MLLNLANVRHAIAGCESNAFTDGVLVRFVIRMVKKPRIVLTTYLSFALLNMSTNASNIFTSKTKLNLKPFTRKVRPTAGHPI